VKLVSDFIRFKDRSSGLPMRLAGGLLLFLATLCTGSGLVPEFHPAPAPAPDPPFLAKPPTPSSWSVRFLQDSDLDVRKGAEKNATGKEEYDLLVTESPENQELQKLAPANNARIVRIQHLNSGKFQGFELEYGGGVVQKMFSYGGYLLFDHPHRDQVLVVTPEDARDLDLDHRADRFQGLEWISREAYRGITRFQGRECNVYELVGHQLPSRQAERILAGHAAMGLHLADPEKPEAPPMPSRVLATALVDRLTRLPVLLQKDGEIQLFEFHPTGARLELPERYENALHAHLQRIQRREQRYKIPQ